MSESHILLTAKSYIVLDFHQGSFSNCISNIFMEYRIHFLLATFCIASFIPLGISNSTRLVWSPCLQELQHWRSWRNTALGCWTQGRLTRPGDEALQRTHITRHRGRSHGHDPASTVSRFFVVLLFTWLRFLLLNVITLGLAREKLLAFLSLALSMLPS